MAEVIDQPYESYTQNQPALNNPATKQGKQNVSGLTNPFQAFGPEWWQGILRQYEPAQYYSAPAGVEFGQASPRKQRFFYNAYDDIMKDFMGYQGTELQGGRQPLDFMEYMETDPWTARYSALPQQQRGATGFATNPRTRFLFNF